MKTAVGYLRVSTSGQTGDDKFGLEAQKIQILEYAARNEISIIKWYTEGGVSGVKEERPELDKIMFSEEVGNPPVEAVIVAKSDRLSRDINLYYYYKYQLAKKNIALVSVQEDFGSMGAFAGVLEALTMCIAEQERINIAKRTSAGRRVKAKAGGYSGGKAPYGYQVKDGQLVVDEHEAEMVRAIFEMRADKSVTLWEIADRLTEMGYRTRNGKKITQPQITLILKNRKTYEGYYRYGPGSPWVQGVHDAII